MTLQKWFDAIGTEESIFDVKDVEAFKHATGALICSIIDLKKEDQSPDLIAFYDRFQKAEDLSSEEASALYKDADNFESNVARYVESIKDQLGNSDHKKLEFMHALNRFIIEDDCDDKDYCVFEAIKEKLFA